MKRSKQVEISATLRKLRSFLDANEPELVYFLVNLWHTQARAITYKELRESILAGDLTMDYLVDWQQDYSNFVTVYLLPKWIEAMEAANIDRMKKYPGWFFDPFADGVRQWTETRSASFVTEVTETQFLGLRAVVQQAAVLENMTVDQLARAIRPMVGLTHPQAVANFHYFNSLISNGVAEKRAQELSLRYAARQHRYRGYNIARTELNTAYNQGGYEGTKQAQEKGYMGHTVKTWCTADDERSRDCEICSRLEGVTIELDEDFDFPTKLSLIDNPTIRKAPPAHPSCRCAVMYREVDE